MAAALAVALTKVYVPLSNGLQAQKSSSGPKVVSKGAAWNNNLDVKFSGEVRNRL